MTTNDLLEALARLRVETGSLACLGCGREHNCSTKGCRILREAADLIRQLTAENVVLQDGQASAIESLRKEIEWKDMVIALAQKEQAKAEAERDALREKQRWIPVTERLPERDVQVLGWYKDNPFSQYRPEVVAWNGNGWVFVYAHRYVTNVTHWMPLPKAPEDGNT